MTKDEKILIVVGALLCVVIVIWRKPIVAVITGDYTEVDPADSIGVSQTTQNASLTRGPAYLMYNQPYAFAPPVGNFLPSITAGQVGQTVNMPTNYAEEYPYMLN